MTVQTTRQPLRTRRGHCLRFGASLRVNRRVFYDLFHSSLMVRSPLYSPISADGKLNGFVIIHFKWSEIPCGVLYDRFDYWSASPACSFWLSIVVKIHRANKTSGRLSLDEFTGDLVLTAVFLPACQWHSGSDIAKVFPVRRFSFDSKLNLKFICTKVHSFPSTHEMEISFINREMKVQQNSWIEGKSFVFWNLFETIFIKIYIEA